jgi:hypothetical protein
MQRWTDWLCCVRQDVCFINELKEGVSIVNLLFVDQYFLFMVCVYTQCFPTILTGF